MFSRVRSVARAALCSAVLATSCGAPSLPSSPPSDLARLTVSETQFAAWPNPSTELLAPADGDPISPLTRAARQPATFVRWPEKFWAKNYRATHLWSSAEDEAVSEVILPEWSWLEFKGQQRRGRLLVRYPGDGRISPPREAWVSALDVMVAGSPLETDIPRAYPAVLRPDAVRLHVPYRTQLDNAPWADANCGPTSLGMALEWLGTDVPSADLRKAVLDEQGFGGNDAGVRMEALATVAQQRGARVLDFFAGDGFNRWSLDDIRTHIVRGHPVILQVLFRALPGRDQSPYWGDHFVVITGFIGSDFLYNDPVDSDGVGYDRIMTSAELQAAMSASDRRYRYAGFAVARS